MHFPRNRIFPRVSSSRLQPYLPTELFGKWVAWDREQTRLIGSGETFAEAKHAAAAAGESAVLMARVPFRSDVRRGRAMLHVVAVFISQMR